MRPQQGLHAGAELGIAGAGRLEVGGALGRAGELQGGGEDLALVHGTTLPPSIRRRGTKPPADEETVAQEPRSPPCGALARLGPGRSGPPNRSTVPGSMRPPPELWARFPPR